MTITQIENNITKLLKNFTQDNFIFEFLLAYGEPKATITRLKKGDLNQLESKGEVTLRKKLFFKVVTAQLHGTIDTLRTDSDTLKQKPRFIIVTDYKTLLAYDTKTSDTLDIKFKDLAKHYDFFLPLAGMEKSTHIDENPADVKASNQLAKLYDEILKSNPTQTHEEVHALNVFLTRLLFCYFAEDSNIFEDNVFTNSISNHTQVNGRDVDSYLARLFDLFNTDDKDRDSSLPEYLKTFPYVNGGLFRDTYPLPRFTTKSRNILIDIGKLDWSAINPDIFGSMIQTVVTPEHRGDMGMHYTSVPNIMKVIKPLFLDELYEEFENSNTSKKKLQNLLERLANLKIFDPACGSGNFLIIAYKELRTLEIKILIQIDRLDNMKQGELFETKKKPTQSSFLFLSSRIELTQFYGIELDDFAHEVAILSLWLTEHQMNIEFFKEFGQTAPPLPLQDGGNIVHDNANRIDWEEVCPKDNGDEIYVLGNPPYLGARLQDKIQKEDMKIVFDGIKGFNSLDYIACWFYKGSQYIKNINAKYAFVSTNSISQGEQVGLLWPHILNENIEIDFAYQSFKWQNNAKSNAQVIVVIIGVRTKLNQPKYLYQSNLKQEVHNINAYLLNSDNIYIYKHTKPMKNVPPLVFGNQVIDGGNLILQDEEKNIIIDKYPNSHKFFKRLYGGEDFLKGFIRWCIWVHPEDLIEAENIPIFKEKFERVKEYRINGGEVARSLVDTPYKFRYTHEAKKTLLVLPRTTTERREYLPIGFLDNNSIVTDAVQVIYDSEPYMMGLLSSKIHMSWVKAIAGRLKTDLRYSNSLCYNTFPFPNISDKQKEEITDLVFNILDEREQHSEKTLAQLYDPNKMPQELKEAHHQLDLAIEKCYRNKPFENDEERLEYLFRLYEEMIAKEGK